MRFRLGVLLGFGAGYYLGAKAGRERYEQINATLRRVSVVNGGSDPVAPFSNGYEPAGAGDSPYSSSR